MRLHQMNVHVENFNFCDLLLWSVCMQQSLIELQASPSRVNWQCPAQIHTRPALPSAAELCKAASQITRLRSSTAHGRSRGVVGESSETLLGGVFCIF